MKQGRLFLLIVSFFTIIPAFYVVNAQGTSQSCVDETLKVKINEFKDIAQNQFQFEQSPDIRGLWLTIYDSLNAISQNCPTILTETPLPLVVTVQPPPITPTFTPVPPVPSPDNFIKIKQTASLYPLATNNRKLAVSAEIKACSDIQVLDIEGTDWMQIIASDTVAPIKLDEGWVAADLLVSSFVNRIFVLETLTDVYGTPTPTDKIVILTLPPSEKVRIIEENIRTSPEVDSRLRVEVISNPQATEYWIDTDSFFPKLLNKYFVQTSDALRLRKSPEISPTNIKNTYGAGTTYFIKAVSGGWANVDVIGNQVGWVNSNIVTGADVVAKVIGGGALYIAEEGAIRFQASIDAGVYKYIVKADATDATTQPEKFDTDRPFLVSGELSEDRQWIKISITEKDNDGNEIKTPYWVHTCNISPASNLGKLTG